MPLETSTKSGPITDPLFAADPNQRKSLEAQRKLLNTIEKAGAQGLGWRQWWRKAKVSSSTLQTWWPRFRDQYVVIENPPGHYVFNEKSPRPVTLAALTLNLGRADPREPFSLFYVRHGHVELTALGETSFRRIIGKADERNKADHVAAHELLDEINWLCSDGIRYNIGIRRERFKGPLDSSSSPSRDPITGKPWTRGNCPVCHKADMKPIQYWHCPSCGGNRTILPKTSNVDK